MDLLQVVQQQNSRVLPADRRVAEDVEKQMACDFEVKQLSPAERSEAISVANESFGFGPDKDSDFGRDWPYVWNDDRMDNTWACYVEGKMAGVVGAYPMEVKMAGVRFRSACVGQVSTLPAYRGRGVMSAILRRVTAEMDRQYDFTWLDGDRMRYGRYGWAFGGVKHCFRTNAKYLPPPPDESAVRPMEPGRDGEMIWRHTQEMPYGIGFNRLEFDQLLSIRHVGGVVSEDAWVVYRGPRDRSYPLLADGPTNKIAALVAYLSKLAKEHDPEGTVAFEAGPYDCPLARMAMKHYSKMTTQAVGGFRLCDMSSYFRRACEAVSPTIDGGSDELSLRNKDTRQEVRIVCSDGRLSVDDRVGSSVREMTTTELSEVVFSTLPVDVKLPGVAADSPLRALLTMPVYLPFSFYAM